MGRCSFTPSEWNFRLESQSSLWSKHARLKARETSGFAELFLLLILFYLELFSQDFQPQRLDDGYLEVIGLTSATLVSGNVNPDCRKNLKLLVNVIEVHSFLSCYTDVLQATTRVGGHGERIAQCKEAVLVTSKSLPMQVDGGTYLKNVLLIVFCLVFTSRVVLSLLQICPIFFKLCFVFLFPLSSFSKHLLTARFLSLVRRFYVRTFCNCLSNFFSFNKLTHA